MQTEYFTGHRRILAEFIKLYRSEPCLWMTTSSIYRDRAAKDTAYERLVIKLKQLDSTADREKVVKKINSLRTNWRKEKKKVDEANGKRPYKPRLWYYNLFGFLDDYTNSSSDLTKDEYQDYEQIGDTEEEEDDPDPLEYEDLHDEEPTEPVIIEEHHTAPLKIIPKTPQPETTNAPALPNLTKIHMPISNRPSSVGKSIKTIPQIKKRALSSDEDDEIITYNRANTPREKREKILEDRHDTFGRNVAMKLRHITDKTQRLLAEKLINDALFMAELGELNMEHGVTSFNTTVQSPYESEFINGTVEEYEPMPQKMQEENELQKTTSEQSAQRLREISRSILRRI